MGQQQLLLIVLGVIIVGIAVVVGINSFSSSSVSSMRDGLTADLTNLASQAQAYYMKPIALGGGSYSFTGFTIPAQLATTAAGRYSISTAGSATSIAFVGYTLAKGANGTDVGSVTLVVGPRSIISNTATNF